jgi:hypothetical protein
MGADYSFKVKNIEIWVPAFFKNNNSSVATMSCLILSMISTSAVTQCYLNAERQLENPLESIPPDLKLTIGQLISKGLFDVIVWTKKPTKNT